MQHLNYSGKAKPEHFIPRRGGGGDGPSIYPRNRAAHVAKLRGELVTIVEKDELLKVSEELADYTADAGVIIEIKGEPNFPLQTKSLESSNGKIVLLNIRHLISIDQDGVDVETIAATVFVKHGYLSYFAKRITEYADGNTKKGLPKNQSLIANIAFIGLAAIDAFWTSKYPLPDLNVVTWWEVWIRRGASDQKRQFHNDAVLAEIEKHNMQVKTAKLILPEHTVFLVRATRHQLAEAIGLLNFVAELRHPAVSAEFFTADSKNEQAQWTDALKQRTQVPNEDAPVVCILDSGVNRGHPLLEELLHEDDQNTVDDLWGRDDYHVKNAAFQPKGHGTAMAGLAAYGDLTPILESDAPIILNHKLESVKILPRVGNNEPEHYGAITQQAMAIAELNKPERKRVFCLAVTATDAPDYKDTGKPSAWSSALDSYSSGYMEDDGTKRLICVSAGNVFLEQPDQYPSLNQLTAPEDPAQAWNVLTVGACTEKVIISDEHGNLIEGLNTIAKQGGLSPKSCTSCLWKSGKSRDWPIKPEIVLEGGNSTYDEHDFIDDHDSLALLTTHFDIQNRLFAVTGDTSAATALAARMGVMVHVEYPDYWSETVRGLLVHSARWNQEMLNGINLNGAQKGEIADILHTFGYGCPDVERAIASAQDRATLICQDTFQPYIKEQGGSAKANEMMLYNLPWPTLVLQELGDTQVRLRVTLSYFIEPNPGSRSADSKYRYQSCGLRFKLQTATETLPNFKARISSAVSAEDKLAYQKPDDVADGWVIGFNNCSRGSIHSDVWQGTAAALATMGHLIVYPVNGWWKLRPQLGQVNRQIRYSLILSLETDAAEVDLYTSIQAEIAAQIPIEL